METLQYSARSSHFVIDPEEFIMPQKESPKVRATIYLPPDVLDEARDAAVHLAGYPARLTLTKLAENALRAELRRLKLLYNQGQDFPRREEELRGGRPIAA